MILHESRQRELAAVYRTGLLQDTLPFWLKHAVDDQYGGFLTAVDRDGTIIDTDKCLWQQGRFTWLLARLYNTVEPNERWLELALTGATFISDHGFDPTDGRLWFHVTRDGRPVRKRRYAFSESFAAIAFAELAQATGEQRYAEQAERLFRAFVDHNLAPPAAVAKTTNERPLTSLGFPMITLVTAQELRQSIGMETAHEWIDRSIDRIASHHLDADRRCVLETVGPEGEFSDHFDGRTLNPGHAIEGAWFLMREGQFRNDPALIAMGCQMLDWMWAKGWDAEFGGMRYFVSADGRPIQEYWHDMKFWWPHNETIIATLYAALLTGDEKYAAWHQQVHDWSYRHFPDPQHGEWFGYLARDGRVTNTLKGNFWKGPFHLPRMQLTCWQLLERGV